MKHIRPLYRVILFIVMQIVVFVMPWYVSIALLVGLTMYISLYVEVLYFAFVFDTLYTPAGQFPHKMLAIAILYLAVVMFVRTRIRT